MSALYVLVLFSVQQLAGGNSFAQLIQCASELTRGVGCGQRQPR